MILFSNFRPTKNYILIETEKGYIVDKLVDSSLELLCNGFGEYIKDNNKIENSFAGLYTKDKEVYFLYNSKSIKINKYSFLCRIISENGNHTFILIVDGLEVCRIFYKPPLHDVDMMESDTTHDVLLKISRNLDDMQKMEEFINYTEKRISDKCEALAKKEENKESLIKLEVIAKNTEKITVAKEFNVKDLKKSIPFRYYKREDGGIVSLSDKGRVHSLVDTGDWVPNQYAYSMFVDGMVDYEEITEGVVQKIIDERKKDNIGDNK